MEQTKLLLCSLSKTTSIQSQAHFGSSKTLIFFPWSSLLWRTTRHIPQSIFSATFTFPHWCACSVTQSCLTLWDSVDYSLPGFSVHGISQTRIMEWVAIPCARVSFWSRDWTYVSHLSCMANRLFTPEPTEKPQEPRRCFWVIPKSVFHMQGIVKRWIMIVSRNFFSVLSCLSCQVHFHMVCA